MYVYMHRCIDVYMYTRGLLSITSTIQFCNQAVMFYFQVVRASLLKNTLRAYGDHLEDTWRPLGRYLEDTWSSLGNHL